MPHGHCYHWRPDILWLHVLSDTLIALSYFSIPVVLLVFYRKRSDFPFPGLLLLFSGFIAACGATHIFGAVTVWHPVYAAEGTAKLFTAAVSTVTAATLWPLLPKALALPTPSALREANHRLELSNEQLRTAQASLRSLNAELEQRVEERTRELEHANTRLLRSNQDLEQFAYLASHDLRAPLRSICGFVDLVIEEHAQALDPEPLGWLQRAQAGGERMQSLVDALLRLAKVESQVEPTGHADLAECAHAALDDLADDVQQAGAVVEVGALPTIQGDRGQWISVFHNLLSNSLKYRTERPLEVVIECQATTESHVLYVSDNGRGIAPEHTEAVLRMFHRLDNQGGPGGHGMGLTICQRIAERHRGRMWVESDGHTGTRICFALKR